MTGYMMAETLSSSSYLVVMVTDQRSMVGVYIYVIDGEI